ncbi:MAG: hypothetical protein AAB375_00505 [Patescibacteria group bacterium]
MGVISLNGKQVIVSGADAVAGVATVNWLLDHGARVTVVGANAPAETEMQKRIDAHLKRVARDGDEYEKLRMRLAWTSNRTVKPTDVNKIFLSLCKKPVIAITGAHGKTTTAVWAAHLIGDAIVAGHAPERPLLPALDSSARVAVIKLEKGLPAASKRATVSTDTMSNLEAAIAAAHMAGVSEKHIQQRISTLPQVTLRQEVIHKSPKLTVVNDALATDPARGEFALQRWAGPTCILICGGVDSKRDYQAWADTLLKRVRRTNIIFLTGSATQKMRMALGEYARGIRAYDSFAAAVKVARARAGLYVSSVILFSPAAKSMALFADENDCGRQFNTLIARQR